MLRQQTHALWCYVPTHCLSFRLGRTFWPLAWCVFVDQNSRSLPLCCRRTPVHDIVHRTLQETHSWYEQCGDDRPAIGPHLAAQKRFQPGQVYQKCSPEAGSGMRDARNSRNSHSLWASLALAARFSTQFQYCDIYIGFSVWQSACFPKHGSDVRATGVGSYIYLFQPISVPSGSVELRGLAGNGFLVSMLCSFVSGL